MSKRFLRLKISNTIFLLLVWFSVFSQYPDALYYSGYNNEIFTPEVAKTFKIKKVAEFSTYFNSQVDSNENNSTFQDSKFIKQWEYHFTKLGDFDTNFHKKVKPNIDSLNYTNQVFFEDGRLKSETTYRSDELRYTNKITYSYFNQNKLVVRKQSYNEDEPCILDSIFYNEKGENIKFIYGDCYEAVNRKKYLRWFDESGNKVLEKTYKFPNQLYTIDSNSYDLKGNYIGNYWFDFFDGKKQLTDCLIIDYNENNKRTNETRFLKNNTEIISKTEYIHSNENRLIEKKVFDFNYSKPTLKSSKKFSHSTNGLLEKVEVFGRENDYNYRAPLKLIQTIKFEFEFWDK